MKNLLQTTLKTMQHLCKLKKVFDCTLLRTDLFKGIFTFYTLGKLNPPSKKKILFVLPCQNQLTTVNKMSWNATGCPLEQ